MATQKNGFFGKLNSDNGDIGGEDQAYLSQIEENIRNKGNEQADAKLEAEQRAREMERIRNASANLPHGATPTPTGTASQSSATKKSNPLENDPRYKEYFDRLRRQKGEKTGGGGSATPSAGVASATGGQVARSHAASQKVGPGAIVRFDDGSIGIYKDAVSGKDYALFYFLSLDGQFQPEGVFLQCYQAKVIGTMPEEHFAKLRDDGAWNRDVVLYHLAKFDYVNDLDKLADHQERKPSKTPARNVSVAEKPAAEPQSRQVRQDADQRSAQANHQSDGQPEEQHHTPPPDQSAPPQADAAGEPGLVKGRQFQIKFGGKQWEAVYWANDGENSIVAHDTHGSWSLMRLDLNRFKESLELLDVVDSATMDAIAQQAAAEK